MDAELIKNAKECAQEQGKSLSQLVADYFYALRAINKKDNKIKQNLPITTSLRGILKDAPISIKEYKDHLEKKYL